MKGIRQQTDMAATLPDTLDHITVTRNTINFETLAIAITEGKVVPIIATVRQVVIVLAVVTEAVIEPGKITIVPMDRVSKAMADVTVGTGIKSEVPTVGIL